MITTLLTLECQASTFQLLFTTFDVLYVCMLIFVHMEIQMKCVHHIMINESSEDLDETTCLNELTPTADNARRATQR